MTPIRQIAPRGLQAYCAEHPGVLLLDVREPWEHALVALPDSMLIPLGSLTERIEDEVPEKEQPIVIYCHHGIRSLQACVILNTLGYTDVVNLSGGIDRYSHEVDAGLPVY